MPFFQILVWLRYSRQLKKVTGFLETQSNSGPRNLKQNVIGQMRLAESDGVSKNPITPGQMRLANHPQPNAFGQSPSAKCVWPITPGQMHSATNSIHLNPKANIFWRVKIKIIDYCNLYQTLRRDTLGRTTCHVSPQPPLETYSPCACESTASSKRCHEDFGGLPPTTAQLSGRVSKVL